MQLPRLLPDDGDGPSPVLLAELRALLRERQILRGRLDSQDAELARLRALLEEQQARLADLQERLRLAEKAATELALEDVVGSVVDSIEKGSAELTGRTVGSARAELRAALRIGRDGTGLTLADPLTAPSALSTVAFDLHPLPPTTIEQQTTTALAAVRQALLVLQDALGEHPPADVGVLLAHVSAAASAPPAAVGELPAALGRLPGELRTVAERVPAAGAELETAAAAVATMTAAPSAPEIDRLASALAAAARALRSTR